jgi:hypothetical protein
LFLWNYGISINALNNICYKGRKRISVFLPINLNTEGKKNTRLSIAILSMTITVDSFSLKKEINEPFLSTDKFNSNETIFLLLIS